MAGSRERLRSLMFERGTLLGIAALVVYMVLAPSHIVDGDNAEFATLSTLGGTAHPSGYPLYLLWLHATEWIPGANPAHTANLATAILGAAMVWSLFQACRAWGASALGATIASAAIGGAPIVLRITTTAEVFALNCLIVALVLWFAAAGGPFRGRTRAIALGLVAGLGIANHMTCVLLAPVGLLGVVRAAREDSRARWATLALSVLALAAGLLPYTYLFLASDTPMSWGTVRSVDDLIAMVTRRDYGGPGAFLPTPTPVPASKQLLAFALTLGRTWLWIPLLVGLVTFGTRVARHSDVRWDWLALALSWFAAGPLLVARFNIEPAGLGLYVSQRFYVLPALLLTIPVAIGLGAIDPVLERRGIRPSVACGLVATLGFAAILAMALPHLFRTQTPAVERYAGNLLKALPQNSVLFIGQDDEYFGVGYQQWALGLRQDVVVVAPQLTQLAWYADRMARRGIAAPAGEGHPMVRLVEQLLASGQQVFVEKRRTEVIEHFTTYPYGTLMKVLPRGAPTPPIDAIIDENKAIYAKFELGYPLPGTDDEFATAIHYRYAGTWTTLGRKAEQLGKPELAAWAYEAARMIGPQL